MLDDSHQSSMHGIQNQSHHNSLRHQFDISLSPWSVERDKHGGT